MVTYLDLAIANEKIKTTDIKGKDYAEVNQRIKAFRMVYPDGMIDTEMLSNENGVCTFKAMVGYYDDEFEGIKWLGIGHAQEKEDSSFINKTSYIENCETSAVGRALGMAGFGIDVSVASAEEVANAIHNQELIEVSEEEANNYIINFGKKHPGEKLADVIKEDIEYVMWYINNHSSDTYFIKCYETLTGVKLPTEEEIKERMLLESEIMDLVNDTDTDYDDVLNHYEVKTSKDMTLEQLRECKQTLEKKLEKMNKED